MRAVRSLGGAVGFLTRVPVAAPLDENAVLLFPLVGAAVGACAGLVASGAVGELPPLAAGALGVGVAAVLTGGLHLDALADTADALGGRSREEALRIMRDHAVGAFGAVALVLVLVVHAAVLGELARRGDAVATAAAAGATSRAVAAPLALGLRDLRSGRGAVCALAGVTAGRAGLTLAIATGLALAAVGAAGAVAVGASAAVAAAGWLGYRRWLGGVTGDALGAAIQLGETATLVSLTAFA